ncbi:hypothetical protein [Gandjariella thermophila]|uniref:Glycosyltransferase RgtA/B/C/D-like domain-containing protein n=1 Tax=Gandjariella thermophila TaxID=1931992 RepID=A0A4D4JDP0_9PSEU|nr:hypothetical protein [Gandjariella thermophila]GDY32506.1 hypothetical protein GTS_41390 [Gandjariella thermophila]
MANPAVDERDDRAGAGIGGHRPIAGRDMSRSPFWALLAFGAVAALGGITLWSAPAPMMAPWDNFILLDGAYRILQGQAPSTDFASPIGPLVYGLTAIGMRMQRVPSLAAVGYGSVVFLGIVAVLGWLVARRRLPAPLAAGFTVFVAVVVVAVRPLGYSAGNTTYAMLYNRYGWALYATLLVLALLRPRVPMPPRALAGDGLILGALLGLLCYCKISFLLVGVGAVGAGLLLGTLPRRLLLALWAVVGFLLVGIAMWLAFGARAPDYLADFVATARAQRDGQRLSVLVRSVAVNLPVGLVAAAVIGGLLVSARRHGRPARPIWRLAAAAGYVLGSSVLVSVTNSQEKVDLPALVLIPLLLAGYAVGDAAPAGARPFRPPKPLLAGVAVLLVGTAGLVAARDMVAIGRAVALRGEVAAPAPSQRMASDRLRDFVVPADATWQTAYRTANEVPAMMNDGMALLRRHVAPRDTVFTVALANPFSFALSLPPSRGEPLWWDVGIDFDRASHPSADRAFGNARWVMVPRMVPGRGCCQQTVQTMLDLYQPYLDRHFTETERTTDWILLARTQ